MYVPTALLAVFCGALGLVIGSFLNVVVWRVPRNQSIVRPRSHCPSCQADIRPRDELPVVSWLLLRGRCRDCSSPISVRYPLVELLTGALFAGLAVRFAHAPARLPAYLYLAAVGIALALIDLDVKRLPNSLTLPSYAVGLVLLVLAVAFGSVDGWSALGRALAGLAAMYAFYFLLWFVTGGRGMGFGDVKLAGVLGLYLGFLGWGSWAVGLFAGFLVGGVVSVGLVIAGQAGRKTRVPYGPFMLTGAMVAIFAGAAIANSYHSIALS
jgi:leader peptidase (prepilin peptidase)/N-methyltransferase